MGEVLEGLFTKQRIIEIYLNVIEWGDGVYGCEAAARRYYGVSCAALSVDQAAGLAAMIPSPRRINPRINRAVHARATRRVLRQMRWAGYLKRDIADMRERMLKELDRGNATSFDLKHGPGGITDIEFMVQYAVLRWAGAHPPLLAWTDNLRLLETIADLGLLPAPLCRGLHDATGDAQLIGIQIKET